jgi:hypothetical protein
MKTCIKAQEWSVGGLKAISLKCKHKKVNIKDDSVIISFVPLGGKPRFLTPSSQHQTFFSMKLRRLVNYQGNLGWTIKKKSVVNPVKAC